MHMRRLASLLALLFFGVSLVAVGAASPAHAFDKNCDDFDTQAQAQNYFEDNGGGPSNNVDGLDSDGDGVVCESNDCPCSNGGGGGGGGGGGTGGGGQKPLHKLTATKAKDAGKPYAVGKVTTYKGKLVRILRQTGQGPFRLLKTARTNGATGKFKAQIKQQGNKTQCFRVVVPATPKYRLTAKTIGCIPPS